MPRALALLAFFCLSPVALAGEEMANAQVAECVRTVLGEPPPKTVHGALVLGCREELSEWKAACARRHGSEDTELWACQQELQALEQELGSSESPPPRQSRTRRQPSLRALAIQAAIKDLSAGRPLPGLPLLDRPVFVRADAVVCRSLGTLANPNTQVLLVTGACSVVPRDRRVKVALPSGSQEYIEAHSLGAVRIYWRAEQESVANAYGGWVRVSELRN